MIAADFHPESAGVFALAFADGAVAAYNASALAADIWEENERRIPPEVNVDIEVGHINSVHAVGNKIIRNRVNLKSCVDPIEDEYSTVATGIAAIAFVPGYKALVITAGSDGKCCVIDFTQPTKTKALPVRSWHIRRPATSLSVVYHADPQMFYQLNGTPESSRPKNTDYCIAVGRQDGKVLVFDLDGKPLGKEILDPKRARIVDVEWAKAEIAEAFSHSESPKLIPPSHTTVAHQ